MAGFSPYPQASSGTQGRYFSFTFKKIIQCQGAYLRAFIPSLTGGLPARKKINENQGVMPASAETDKRTKMLEIGLTHLTGGRVALTRTKALWRGHWRGLL